MADRTCADAVNGHHRRDRYGTISSMHSLDPAEDFALRLVRRFLLLCEHPRTRRRMLRMVRQTTHPGPGQQRLYRWLNRMVLHPAVRRRGVPASAMRLELLASQLVGLAMMRYVLRVEPFASASVEEVVALSAPAARAALVGEEGLRAVLPLPDEDACSPEGHPGRRRRLSRVIRRGRSAG